MLVAMLHPGLLAAAVVLLQPDAVSQPPTGPAPIFGGTVSAPGAWPSAVAISAGAILCTGTLVAQNVILTAAHCLEGVASVDQIYVRTGNDINLPDAPLIPAIAYGTHPEFCGEDTCKEDIHDYGYIILAEPQTIPPTRVITDQDEWDEVMELGHPITLVGYGLTESMTITGIKREVEVEVTRFSKSGLEFQGGGDGKDSCQGDSGGPAFLTLGSGEVVLAGVTSRGYSCGKGGFYAVPYGGLCWLRDSSGLDLTNGCGTCDCLDTDPNRSEGCGCRSDEPRTSGAWLVLLGLLGLRRLHGTSCLSGWRHTRKRSLSSRNPSSSSSSSSGS